MKFNIANNGAKKKTLSLINKGRERNDGKRFEKSSKKPIKESMTTNVASIKILTQDKKKEVREVE